MDASPTYVDIFDIVVSPTNPCLGNTITINARIKNTYNESICAKVQMYFINTMGDTFVFKDVFIGNLSSNESFNIVGQTVLTRFGTKFGIQTKRGSLCIPFTCNCNTWVNDTAYEWNIGVGAKISSNKTVINPNETVTFTLDSPSGITSLYEIIGQNANLINTCNSHNCTVTWTPTTSTPLGDHWFQSKSSGSCSSDLVKVNLRLAVPNPIDIITNPFKFVTDYLWIFVIIIVGIFALNFYFNWNLLKGITIKNPVAKYLKR